MSTCPHCGAELAPTPIPPEPPIGTWVKDRHGGVTQRHPNGDWAPRGCLPYAKWEPMWLARGPLIECGPWGDLP